MYTISKEIEFDAAHRLIDGYVGKCSSIHGHRYRVVFEFEAISLDEYGFVIDFTQVKELAKEWIYKFWDHGTILNEKDPLFKIFSDNQQKVFALFNNPTAENMAKFLYKMFRNHWSCLIRVVVWETPTSSASYEETRQEFDFRHLER
jgi:6-pyruvoyltetrahydropterin/6-carboxytetrahydropterin synthase